jgi:hypothetical protein
MTRTLCDELSEPVVQAYNDMEDEILALIGRQLGKNKQVSDTSKWRLRQLAMSGELERRTVEIIASYAGGIDEAVVDALYAAALAEVTYTDAAIQEAVRRGILEGNIEQPASRSATFAVQQFQKQAEVDTNLVNTVMQYSAKSKYVNAVNEIADTVIRSRQEVLNVMGEGAAAAVSGQMSLQEATRHTIHKLARQGCPGFIDKAGREWTPEAYVSMDMRSTLGNTAREAQDTRCTEFGVQLIAVSSHNGARPLCAPYQGRIFSRNGTSGVTTDGAGRQIEYIPLTQTSYGQPAGLFGINCGHQQYPFIPGVNVQRYFPYDEDQNAERYKEFQKQRAMERQIRSQKRECMMLQEAGDEEGLKDASKKLREYKNKYRDYSREHGLGMHNDRTQVYGYDRSKSMKTVWSERKNLIRSPDISISEDFNANWNVINSPEYLKKFKGVTKTSIGDRSVMAAAKRCITANDGTEMENAVILSSSFGVQKGNDIKLGLRGGHIDIPQGKQNSYIVVHNHGNSSPFSYEDFVLVNNDPRIKTLIAAAHNGTVYKISVGNGKRLDISDEMKYNHYMMAFNRNYDHKTGNLAFLTGISKHLGWEFEYE